MNVEELIVYMQEIKSEHPALELSDILRMCQISETQQQVQALKDLTKQLIIMNNK